MFYFANISIRVISSQIEDDDMMQTNNDGIAKSDDTMWTTNKLAKSNDIVQRQQTSCFFSGEGDDTMRQWIEPKNQNERGGKKCWRNDYVTIWIFLIKILFLLILW